ncbi:NACHT domain-containing protein [Actinoplanes sp. CA-054009]
MAGESPLTLKGALQVFHRYDPKAVTQLDELLGGVILGERPPSPAAVWAWADRRTGAARILRDCLNGMDAHLPTVRGFARVELAAAAHTVAAASAFFDAVSTADGRADQRRPGSGPGELFAALYETEVLLPRGTPEINDTITVYRWHGRLGELYARRSSETSASVRYEKNWLALAAVAPDFLAWSGLRAGINEITPGLAAVLQQPLAALSRLEALLRQMTALAPEPAGAQPAAMRRANRDLLDQPLVSSDSDRYPEPMAFPTIRAGYIEPSYRLSEADNAARPADDTWWAGKTRVNDLDLMLTRYFASYSALRQPLLVLGHPGAGKSMLTKVLAARLPESSYTVVRVPLRRVSAGAPLHQQIQEALDLTTHGRVSWHRLAAESAGTIRVVLLDGLDELLQASPVDRSAYLGEVMEFQRAEAAQDQPVMVVVTSRTIVADRFDIPPGTLVVKLEDFDDDQVRRWLVAWRQANAAGQLRMLTAAAALTRPELARQPLLLLMLAIYWADPDTPEPAADLSLATLYGRLLRSFAVREVRKRPEAPLRGERLDAAAADQLHRLSVAAIGMFNRGRQDITEQELGEDLSGLRAGDVPRGGLPGEAGQRVLAEFFFVHAAEARARAGRDGGLRRCYEFLHATFGEYLIAAYVKEVLIRIADAAFGGRFEPREPEDDLLFALLSHQVLAERWPILEFAGELLGGLPEADRENVTRTLGALIDGYPKRVDAGRHPLYRPTSEGPVQRLATYSANLVLLRLTLAGPDGLPLERLCEGHAEPLEWWRSTVTLWRAVLGAGSRQALLGTLAFTGGTLSLLRDKLFPPEFADIQYARLIGDRAAEQQLRLGAAVQGRLVYYIEGDDWAEMMTSWLTAASVHDHRYSPAYVLAKPPPDTPPEVHHEVIDLVSEALGRQSWRWSTGFLGRLLGWFDEVYGLHGLTPTAIITTVYHHPGLLETVPALRNTELYRTAHATAALSAMAKESAWPNPQLTELRRRLADEPEVSVTAAALNLAKGWIPPPENVYRVAPHLIISISLWPPPPHGTVTEGR